MGGDGRLGIYVHFPYCTRHCPYCDFTVTVRPIDHGGYRDAVLAELATRAPAFAGRDPALSVYFGGGTPGLWSPACVGAVIDGVAATLGLAAGAEITVECNPEDVTVAHLEGLRAAGVNRISLGTQSFSDALLARLGRAHDAATNRRAVAAVQAVGFADVSLDLMHGAVGQSVAEAVADVEAALAFGPTHVSTYQLTIEPRTAFGARAARGERLLADEDHLAEMYLAVEGALEAGGLALYEVSNAARPGHEAVHNSLYWTFAEYLALGAGAHGFRKLPDGGGARWENARKLSRYLEGARAGRPAEESRAALDADDLLAERLLTGLRLRRGIVADPALEVRYGLSARRLAREGLLDLADGRWRATSRGRLLLNRVTGALLVGDE